MIFVDANVFIRYAVDDPGDRPDQHEAARDLIDRIDQGIITATTAESVLADVAYVLAARRYRAPRPIIADLLEQIIDLRGMRLADRDVFRRAIDLYRPSDVDFDDALIVARMEQLGIGDLASYDRGFDQFPQIRRHESDWPDA